MFWIAIATTIARITSPVSLFLYVLGFNWDQDNHQSFSTETRHFSAKQRAIGLVCETFLGTEGSVRSKREQVHRVDVKAYHDRVPRIFHFIIYKRYFRSRPCAKFLPFAALPSLVFRFAVLNRISRSRRSLGKTMSALRSRNKVASGWSAKRGEITSNVIEKCNYLDMCADE